MLVAAKNSEYLHEFIRALSKSEKRFVQLWLQRHSSEETVYSKLFNYLNKQEEYAIEHLKCHFKGEKFVNQLAINKQRLYDQIQKALFIYEMDNNAESKALSLLNQVEYLYNKALYHQSSNFFKKAFRHIQKNDLAHLYVHLNEWRSKLAPFSPTLLNVEKDIMEGELSYLKSRLQALGESPEEKNSPENRFEKTSKDINELLKTKDYLKAESLLEANSMLLENHSLKEENSKRITLLSEQVLVKVRLGKELEAKYLLQDLKKMKDLHQTENWLLNWKRAYYISMLRILELDFSLVPIHTFFTEIDEFIEEYFELIPEKEKAQLKIKMASLLFASGEVKTAKAYTTYILNFLKVKDEAKLYANVLLLNNILSMEVDKLELASNELTNMKRYFQQNELKDAVDFCRFLSKYRIAKERQSFIGAVTQTTSRQIRKWSDAFQYIPFEKWKGLRAMNLV